MKRIIKHEPSFFTEYLHNNKPNTWEELSRAIGKDIRIYILSGTYTDDTNEKLPSEQNYQCAYTEVRVEPDSNSSHIDHFYKRQLYTNLKFNWSNLFVATNNEHYGAKYKDKVVTEKNDYSNIIIPAQEDPSQYFKYDFTGIIEEKNSDVDSKAYKKAKKTKDVFYLNHYSLKERRKTVANQVSDFYNQLPLEVIKNEIGEFDQAMEEFHFSLKLMYG